MKNGPIWLIKLRIGGGFQRSNVSPGSCNSHKVIGMLTGQIGFADVRKGMSPQMHKKGAPGGAAHFQAGSRTLTSDYITPMRRISFPAAWEHGQAWQSPAGTADCSGSAHAAIPASCALPSCFCGGDRQTPAECAQTAPGNGHAQPPA